MRDVILAHGLWVPGIVMQPLAARLERAGFRCHNFSYMGAGKPLEAHAERLARLAREIGPAHFVGHSLGGLVILDALSREPRPPAGRVVLLGTPARGCYAGRRIARHAAGRWFLGESERLWREGRAARWTRPEALGVIAGTLPFGLGRMFGALPGVNDGVVGLDETAVDGMAERAVLPVGHSQMLFSAKVGAQLTAFLANGKFLPAAAYSPLLAFVLLPLLGGCETLSYYAQAVGGQMSLMARAHPVAEVIADPATPPPLRERLALAREIRDYAVKELKLPDNGSYRSYAELDRPYVVWNVVAAPEFSLQPVQSCFPVAGCVPYRGFFALEAAERHAARLREAGNDVSVRGVPAYSTLGRFDDPLLSTFIRYPDAELARLVFHELAHQRVYVQGDATFNESFAVTVEREGVRRWLAATGRGAQLQGFAEGQKVSAGFYALLAQTRARLSALYAEKIAPALMRERKAASLGELKQTLAANPRFRALEPNNALLAAFATYTQMVPVFEQVLAEEGGDLERFYARVKAMASAPSSRGPSPAPIQ